jgi:hypothetical protein
LSNLGQNSDALGIFRGSVIKNVDPVVKGRLKIFVPGIYPDEFSENPDLIPWAEPVMPLYGGNFTNKRGGDLNRETGVTTIPHVGAEVWLFFENNSHLHPKFFGACQGGEGWHSEHSNQHVIKTDNVRIRVDENPLDSASTCKFTSYNENNNERSRQKVISDMPTRIDIEVWNEGSNAVNIIVKGNVNMKIDGDLFEEHTGDKHLTHTGNVYKQHTGDVYEVHDGTTIKHQNGTNTLKHEGDFTYIHTGDKTYKNPRGNVNETIFDGTFNSKVVGDYKLDITGLLTYKITGDLQNSVVGNVSEYVNGIKSVTSEEHRIFTTEDILNVSKEGNIINQAFGTGQYDTKTEDYPNKLRGGIISNGNYIKTSGNGTSSTTPWTYRYDTSKTDTIPVTYGIVETTGTEIHHNDGYTPGFEYNISEA